VMKQIFVLTLLAGSLAGASGQGTFQLSTTLSGLNEIPPNINYADGFGTFTLTGNNLAYEVGLFPATSPTVAGVFGPAGPTQTGPLQFNLVVTGIEAPLDGFPGSVAFHGTVILTADQIGDLQNGLWYVNIADGNAPDGLVRGQIMPVPEPKTVGLTAAGLVLWWLIRKRTRL
ncbi:MAG: CHRD domain-containing protein, partial [Verrucomicrobia bacterium]|nr:CHRD domain-containing protein [Verrucomicrobiota bacterium]